MIAIACGFALGGLVPLWVLLDYLKRKRTQTKWRKWALGYGMSPQRFDAAFSFGLLGIKK